MKTIFGFLEEHGNQSFREKPFCQADALICAQIAYLNLLPAFARIPPLEHPLSLQDIEPFAVSGLLFKEIFWTAKNCRRLFWDLRKSRRYVNLKIRNFVQRDDPKREMQFAAAVILPGDGSEFVAFRGSDDQIISYKEDLNMAYMHAVPAQIAAAEYLDMYVGTAEVIRVGGHSKGGNLAVYASAAFAHPIRLTEIYNLDGPGFRMEFLESDAYRRIRAKVKKFVPASSVIGMLMYNPDRYTVVKCRGLGQVQHDLFNWGIHDGEFIPTPSKTMHTRLFSETLTAWMETLEDEHRRLFIDTIFWVLQQTGKQTVSQLTSDKLASLRMVLQAVKGLDAETKRFVKKTIFAAIRVAPQGYRTVYADLIRGSKKVKG